MPARSSEPRTARRYARTYADISRAQRDFGFAPAVPPAEDIRRFVLWYRQYHGL
jgi:UDP-glucuronate 4-epimerase